MYLGAPPTSAAFVTDTFSGTGSQTDFTMSVAPASTTSMLVVVGGVLQDPANYAIVGMTLRFSTAPPAGTGNISVRYMGIPASGVVNTAYRTVTDFTATAGQTAFTVPSYTVGFIDVFRNGARLGADDFTATNGTSITLAKACNALDLVTTVSFSVSSVLNAIQNTAGSVTALNLAPGAARANFGAGAVLQVVQTVKTDAFTGSLGAQWTDVAGLSATITPSSATSKILITADVKGAGGASYSILRSRLLRDATAVYVGDAASSRPRAMGQFYGGGDTGTDGFYTAQLGGTFLDSPTTTSATTYKIQIGADGNSQVVFINRTQNDRDASYYDARVVSSITLMEIAA